MKKWLTNFFVILCCFICSNQVLAEDNTYPFRKNRFENIFAVYDNVRLFYGQTYIVNNSQAFCIEPGAPIDSNLNFYYGSTDTSVTGLSDDILEKVKLLSFYGYRSPYHINTDRFYLATQELIWELITGKEVYWVSEENINGPRIDIENEKNIINNLINKHYVLPSFANQEFKVDKNQILKITDSNNVLEHYKLDIQNDAITISGNNIIIQGDKIDKDLTIGLTLNSHTDLETFFYYNGNNQKMMSTMGNVPPVNASFKVRIDSPLKLKILKVDMDTNNVIKQSGIKFRIKNMQNNEYLSFNNNDIFETNEEGYFIVDEIDNGSYLLEELEQEVNGYIWNNQPVEFSINENAASEEIDGIKYVVVKFKNKPVKGKVIIKKIGEEVIYHDNTISYIDKELDDVVFNLYADNNIYSTSGNLEYEKNDYIDTFIINDGNLTIDNLSLGNYCIKEVKTSDEYILDEEMHCFSIDYKDQYTDEIVVELFLKNYLKKGILEFTKTDFLTGKGLKNTKIAIYNYNDILIYEDYTNEFGKIILEGLPIGKYYLVETVPADGYQLNNEKIYFEIKENNEIVNANMDNIRVNVPSTNKDNNYLFLIASIIIFLLGGCFWFYEKK